MRISKRGVYRGVLVNLILALLVIALVFVMIFRESFTTDDINYETCRQSAYLRSALPETTLGAFTTISFKDDYPLKCKTMIVNIEKDDLKDKGAEKKIADTIASCWALYGNGDYDVFPSDVYGLTTSCTPCARVHLSDEAKQYMIENTSFKIDFGGYIKNQKFKEGVTYYNYLRDVGGKFSPFDPGFVKPFNLTGETFFINGSRWKGFWAVKDFHTNDGITEEGWGVFGNVTLPRYLNANDGDLIIYYGTVTASGKTNIGYLPYLYYYQIYQPNITKQLNEIFFQWGLTGADPTTSERICNFMEGVPA